MEFNRSKFGVVQKIIPIGDTGQFDEMFVQPIDFIQVKNVQYILYTGYNLSYVARGGIAFSTSHGETWIKHPANPIIPLGGTGAFDDTQVVPVAFIYMGTEFEMPWIVPRYRKPTSDVMGKWYLFYKAMHGQNKSFAVAYGEHFEELTKKKLFDIASDDNWGDFRVDFNEDLGAFKLIFSDMNTGSGTMDANCILLKI